MKKMLSLLFVLITMMTMCLPFSASAASVKAKSDSYEYYTISTGNSNAKLTITPSKGKYAQNWVNQKNGKSKVYTTNLYGNFTVSINGKAINVNSRKVTVTLQKNSFYTIRVSCNGTADWLYTESKPINIFDWRRSGNKYWKSPASVKLDTGWFGPEIW